MIYRIRTPYKKCRHCGHRVENPNDRVCPKCYVPAGHADRAVSTGAICVCVMAALVVLLLIWPSIHEIAMEIVD